MLTLGQSKAQTEILVGVLPLQDMLDLRQVDMIITKQSFS